MHLWLAVTLLVVVLVVSVMRLAMASFRRKVRRRFVALLQERRPEVKVLRVTAGSIAGRNPDGTAWSLALGRLYQAASSARTPEEEEALFTEWTGAVDDMETMSLQTLSLEQHGDLLRPVLAGPEKRQQLTGGGEVPFTAVPALGLEVLYAVDAEHSLMYVTEPMMRDLGLDREGVHARAMANLRATFAADAVRGVLAKPTFSVIKLLDGYDATRLLLIPEYLEPGETIAAVIPDRDTLAFCPADEGFDWHKLPTTAAGPHGLLKRPVKVTSEGFEMM